MKSNQTKDTLDDTYNVFDRLFAIPVVIKTIKISRWNFQESENNIIDGV